MVVQKVVWGSVLYNDICLLKKSVSKVFKVKTCKFSKRFELLLLSQMEWDMTEFLSNLFNFFCFFKIIGSHNQVMPISSSLFEKGRLIVDPKARQKWNFVWLSKLDFVYYVCHTKFQKEISIQGSMLLQNQHTNRQQTQHSIHYSLNIKRPRSKKTHSTFVLQKSHYQIKFGDTNAAYCQKFIQRTP